MKIEQHAPELERLISLDQTMEQLADGFGGPGGPAEGPLWWHENAHLVFSDISHDRRMIWSPTKGLSVMRERTQYANGLTRDRQGRLVICESRSRRVVRIELDGSPTVIANNYRGQRLNRPNDVVVASNGSIYFTDPMTANVKSELDVCGVYRVSPDLGEINMLVWDFVMPNGLALSPDEQTLYVDDSKHSHIRAFEVESNGLLNRANGQVFATMHDERLGVADGMKVDVEGNIYCTGPGGIWIFDPSGKHLGTLATGMQTTNLAWGDEDWKTLYVTTRHTLERIRMSVAGVPVPRGNR
jgi:gluconolactonase